MRLLIVSPITKPEIGGPATYINGLIPRLSAKHQLSIITFTKNPKLPKTNLIVSIPQHNHLFGSLFRQAHLFIQIINLARRSDLIYAQGPLVVGLASALVGKLLNKPVVLKFVGDISWEQARSDNCTKLPLEAFYLHSRSIKYHLLTFFSYFSLRLSSHVVCPSIYLADFLHNTYSLSYKKIKVIPNAVDTNTETIKKDPHQLIFVGRLVNWKNVDEVIKAVCLARKHYPWKLLIVGDGPQLRPLHQLVEHHKSQSYISFLGRKTSLVTHRLIAASQYLLLYSDYEGLPHTVIEAVKLKTIPLLSDIKPHQELFGDSKLLIKTHQPKLLAQTINQNLTLSPNTIRQFQSTYTWKNHINKLCQLFTRVAHG